MSSSGKGKTMTKDKTISYSMKQPIADLNLQYALDYRLEEMTNCDERCDPYCRCSIITDVQFGELSSRDIIYPVLNNLNKKDIRKKNPIFEYCLERVVSRIRSEDLEWEAAGGYYGQELMRIVLRDPSLLEDFLELRTPTEWIEYYLTKEYGYVLDEFKDKEWVLEKIPLSEVEIPHAYRPLDEEQINKYFNQYNRDKVTLCVLTRANNSLIDGYHRLMAAKKAETKQIAVLKPRE